MAAAILSCYWFYKFAVLDKDLCLVDYETLEKAEDDKVLPMLSLCFRNPFLEKSLNSIHLELNSTKYINHLIGKDFDVRWNEIDFYNVTINLKNYYQGSLIIWKNGSQVAVNSSSKIFLKLNDITFSGIIDKKFFKCFGVQISGSVENM